MENVANVRAMCVERRIDYLIVRDIISSQRHYLPRLEPAVNGVLNIAQIDHIQRREISRNNFVLGGSNFVR